MRRMGLLGACLVASLGACDGAAPGPGTESGTAPTPPTDAAATGSAPATTPSASASAPAGAPPAVLATAKEPTGLVLDGRILYWLEAAAGEIATCPREGGAATRLAAGIGAPSALAVDDAYVYVGESAGDERVLRLPKAGGSVEQVSRSPHGPVRAVVVDATHVYFCAEGAHALYLAPKAGGTPRRLAEGCGERTQIVLAGRDLYFTGSSPRGPGLFQVPTAGGPTRTVFESAEDAPAALALRGGDLYFTTRGSGRFLRVPKTGGAARVLFAGSPADGLGGLAVDASHAYLALGRGPVLRVAVDGAGPALELGSEADAAPTGVVLDATSVYWARRGAIVKVPRPR
ncbi:MAG: hypothetical protein HY908_33570 [Myxococcales bacterium]|nr:hypothetical protein [Myxococcales bacterium]